MSQIAQGFACHSGAMSEANLFCRAHNHRAMTAVLSPYEVTKFAYGGYVIVVVVEWLRGQGIELPRTETDHTAHLLKLTDPLMCATQSEAEAIVAALRGLSPSPQALATFWHEWTGEDVAEAQVFMPAGLAWLTAVAEAGSRNAWCIVLEG